MTSQRANIAHRKIRRIAIAGFGAIGAEVAEALNKGIPGCELTAISARSLDRVRAAVAHFARPVKVVRIEELEASADVVVECAPAALLTAIVRPFVAAGKTAIVLSVGALLASEELVELARQRGGQIVVPTGALLGLDAVTAAMEGTINSVKMITRKPVRGLVGAPYLQKHNIDLADITEPTLVFRGSPREAATGFPANLNVAVALSLAGIGPDRTTLEIWADPKLSRNTHAIEVEADSASFSMAIQNVPSHNPKTGRITALSVISYLRKLSAPLRVGS